MTLRVLHFSNSTVRGGAEEHMLTLLTGLDRSRFTLALACPAELVPLLPDLPEDVTVTTLVPRGPGDVRTGWRLAHWLRSQGVDVVHAHLSCASRAVAPWARLGGVGVTVETPHVRESWRRGWKRSYVLDRAVGAFVDAYIAVSGANARHLVEEVRLPARKIRTIRNGIDVERFAPGAARPDPRPALGITRSEVLLVCAARLEPQKGHAVLLEALGRLPPSVRGGLRLACLGEGRLLPALRQQARQLGLDDRVVFAGYTRHMDHWLAAADIFVLPSLYEGLPLVAMEACAAGCAVVATAVDGTPEVISHGHNGLLVPPGDAGALAEAILRLARNVVLRSALGEEGRWRARREFSAERQIAATAEFYDHLYAARRHPRPAAAEALVQPRSA
ncbi:MAG: glycosyltransferase [Terriglobales bacterium]